MGGAGCICPESAILRSLTTHILLRRDEVVLMDMYAGVEHLGRATSSAVDAMLIVVEPTARSLGTAAQIKSLAEDLNLRKLFIVGSKVENEDDLGFIKERSPGLPVLGYIPDDPRVRKADREGLALYQIAPELAQSAQEMVKVLLPED
jgi:CO dehydrogenase maturation factor